MELTVFRFAFTRLEGLTLAFGGVSLFGNVSLLLRRLLLLLLLRSGRSRDRRRRSRSSLDTSSSSVQGRLERPSELVIDRVVVPARLPESSFLARG